MQNPLTDLELDILICSSRGMGGKAIADKTGLSVNTIKAYRARMVRKLGANNLGHAVAIGIARGWIPRAQQAA